MPDTPPKTLIWPLFQALSDVADLVQQRKEQYGSSDHTIQVLALLRQQNNVRPTDLARQLGLSPAAVTRKVKVLTERGVITVSSDPADKRGYVIHLTAQGEAELDQFMASITTSFQQGLQDWNEADLMTLTNSLQRFLTTAAQAPTREPSEPPPPERKWWQK